MKRKYRPVRPLSFVLCPSAGFTLLELLIGAVISAVLLAALSGVFYGMIRAQKHAYAKLAEMLPRAQAIALIKNDIENMVAPKGILCGPVLGQTLGGGTQRTDYLAFYASTGKIGVVNPWGDIQKIEYSFGPPPTAQTPGTSLGMGAASGANAGTGPAASTTASAAQGDSQAQAQQLVRTVTRNLLATNLDMSAGPYDPYDQIETTVLLDGIGSLQFQYFDGQDWYDYWDSTAVSNALPTAVHVRVDFPTSSVTAAPTATPIEIYCEVAGQSVAVTTAPVS